MWNLYPQKNTLRQLFSRKYIMFFSFPRHIIWSKAWCLLAIKSSRMKEAGIAALLVIELALCFQPFHLFDFLWHLHCSPNWLCLRKFYCDFLPDGSKRIVFFQFVEEHLLLSVKFQTGLTEGAAEYTALHFSLVHIFVLGSTTLTAFVWDVCPLFCIPQ